MLLNLNTDFLPSNLAAPLQRAGFLNFIIYNPFVRLNISSIFYLHLGGTASFNEWGQIIVEGILQRADSSHPLALGLSIPHMLKELTGIATFASERYLPRSATVALSVCSLEMDYTKFDSKLLNRLQAIDGISFISEFKFPNCSGDTLSASQVGFYR